MKKIAFFATLALLLCSAGQASAQIRQKDYEMEKFNSIVIGGDFDVTVEDGKDYLVSINMDRQFNDCIVCSVDGSVLTLTIDEKKLLKDIDKFFKTVGKDKPSFSATVYVPGSLEQITLEDQAVLKCTKVIEGESVRINVTDNAVLKSASIDSRFANINTDMKGNASVIATADGITVTSAGTSNLNLTQNCKTSDITASGFCNIVLDGEVDNLTLNAKGTTRTTVNGKADAAGFNLSGACFVNAHELELNDAAVRMNGLCSLSESASKTLSVDLQAGSSLTFDNHPAISVVGIKLSTVKKYTENEK